jgi:putative tricarboxylic transport membrane protein
MESRRTGEKSAARIALALVLAAAAGGAGAQAWAPQKNVEIVAGSAPGGSNDNTARTLERILLGNKLVTTTITVVNRPGGGGSIAYTYVSQKPGDAHVLSVTSSNLLSNHIIGSSTLSPADFTPLAMLYEDHAVFMVAADSPLKTGKDLADRLKKDPRALTVGFANAFGSSRHMAAALLIKTLGGNARDLKPVVFKGSAEAITALLGGHIDWGVAGAVNAIAHVSSGRMRVIAVAAPQRLSGPLSVAPTWKEQGVNLVYGNWRGVFGPKGLNPAHVGYWESALRRLSQTPEWKADLEKNHWSEHFMTGAALGKEIEKEYSELKATLVDVGLAK